MSGSAERGPLGRRLSLQLDERVGFALLTVAIAGFYFLVRAPVLDPVTYLDPWIYTATFTNYHFIVTEFSYAYYPSRLPWIIPGIVANKLFSPVPAFFVLHVLFFVGAGLFAFLLFRKYFGSYVAFLSYAALMLTPIFYDAFSNDYPDGAVLAYIFGACYFALGAWGSKRRALRFAFAGFFLAAAVATNLLAVFLAVGVAIVYVAVFHVEAGFRRNVLRDSASASSGGLLLLLGCGVFARLNGGDFFFFMSSIRATRTISFAVYKAHGYAWLKGEPELLIPLFALCAFALLLSPRVIRRWRSDVSVRFAVGSAVFLAYFAIFVCFIEFADSGYFLETPYYFSYFNVGIALVLGSVLHLLASEGMPAISEWRVRVFVVAGAVATAVPTFVFYRLHRWSFGEPGAVVTLVLMGLCLVTIVVSRVSTLRTRAAVVGAGALLLVFAANYAAASGLRTASVFWTTSSTFRERREALSLATELMQFMKQNGLQDSPPGFWYDAKAQPAFTGMQSTYLWGDTWVGLDMPRIDKPMRTLLAQRKPKHLVLLCVDRACSGAPAVLDRAGYPNKLIRDRLLVSGRLRVWVHAMKLLNFAANAATTFYSASQSAFLPSNTRSPLRSWSFVRGVPSDWSPVGSPTIAPGASGARVDTTDGQYAYELQSSSLDLPAGSYAIRLSGAVSRGGLQIGVLDVSADSWLKEALYWSGQHRHGKTEMGLDFTLTDAEHVQLVLSNWAPKDTSSRWVLRNLQLVRLR